MPSGWGAGVFWGFRPIVTASLSADWHLNVRANSFEISQLKFRLLQFPTPTKSQYVRLRGAGRYLEISAIWSRDSELLSFNNTFFNSIHRREMLLSFHNRISAFTPIASQLACFSVFFAVISSFLRLRGAQHWDPIGPCILFVTWENRVQDRRLGISRPRGVGKGGQGGHVPYYKS